MRRSCPPPTAPVTWSDPVVSAGVDVVDFWGTPSSPSHHHGEFTLTNAASARSTSAQVPTWFPVHAPTLIAFALSCALASGCDASGKQPDRAKASPARAQTVGATTSTPDRVAEPEQDVTNSSKGDPKAATTAGEVGGALVPAPPLPGPGPNGSVELELRPKTQTVSNRKDVDDEQEKRHERRKRKGIKRKRDGPIGGNWDFENKPLFE